MTNPGMHNDINIRSSRFLVARTVGVCWRCGTPTPLFALAVPPGHMVLELDDEAPDDGTAVDSWRIAAENAFLFYIEFLPAPIERRLKQFTQTFRQTADQDAAGDSSWANHCEHCGSLLDDHEIFCEPDGAFLPTNEATASVIHLIPIEEAFEAIAAGYAYEPAFFSAMR